MSGRTVAELIARQDGTAGIRAGAERVVDRLTGLLGQGGAGGGHGAEDRTLRRGRGLPADVLVEMKAGQLARAADRDLDQTIGAAAGRAQALHAAGQLTGLSGAPLEALLP